MAAQTGPPSASDVNRRKERPEFTATLQDQRQWPTLGQSTVTEQKKKAATLGNSASNSTGKSASSSRLKSGSNSGDRSSSSAHHSPLKASISSVSSDAPSFSSSSSPQIQTDDHHTPGSSGHSATGDERRHSGDLSATATKKKGGKKKWEKVVIEPLPSRVAVMEQLRARRDEFLNSPEYQNKINRQHQSGHRLTATDTTKGALPVGSANSNTSSVAVRPGNAYNPSASTAASIGPNSPASVAVQANNQPFRNSNNTGNNPFDYNRRAFKKPNPSPVAFNHLNRGRIVRKIPGFRPRDMAYDEDYNGDGHSDGADDNGSQYDYDGGRTSTHNESGFSGGDWLNSSSMYYDYNGGVDGSGFAGSAQGYQQQPDEYSSGYGYGYPDVANGGVVSGGESQGGLDENGLYFPPSPMPAYTPSPAEVIELKEMIKYQIEYYFSPDNLQKDFFLRRMMAKDGSVMLGLVASFQRVRALTQDFNLIIESIVNSDLVEIMENFMIRPRETPDLWPIHEKEDDKHTGYYYINEETDDFRHNYGVISGGGFDETDESGTGEDVSYPDDDDEDDDEREGRDEEDTSMDGSELSEDMRQLIKSKSDHHLESMQTMSEKFLQQVM